MERRCLGRGGAHLHNFCNGGGFLQERNIHQMAPLAAARFADEEVEQRPRHGAHIGRPAAVRLHSKAAHHRIRILHILGQHLTPQQALTLGQRLAD